MESGTASNFVREITKHYYCTFPLGKEWINIKERRSSNNAETIKTLLTNDINEVNKTAGTNFPLQDVRELKDQIRKLRKHFKFDRIPDHWISDKTPLPLSVKKH